MEKKKSRFLKGICVVIGIFIILTIFFNVKGCVDKNIEFSKKAKETYQWPNSELAKLLPKPETKNGEIILDSEENLNIDVFADEKEFKSYVEKCKEKGFTYDYSSTDTTYSALNENGYDLYISYSEENDYELEHYSISLDIPKKDEANTAEEQGKTQEANQSSEQSNQNETSNMSTDEFKAAMDSYEQFFNKYVDFMNKYNSSEDTASLLNEYSDFMKQYNDTMQKMNAIDTSSLTSEQLAYYTEVQARITKKLAEIEY